MNNEIRELLTFLFLGCVCYCVQNFEPAFYLYFVNLRFHLAWSNCELVTRPEVTLAVDGT